MSSVDGRVVTQVETLPVALSDKVISRAVGDELRRTREAREWSRAQLCQRLPSGSGDRTVLSYEHGTRHLTVLRLIEICQAMETSSTELLSTALQRAHIRLDNLTLRVDLHALLDDETVAFRPLAQWTRNKLTRHPDGIAELAPAAVEELATFMGCARRDLTRHLAQFMPETGRFRALPDS